MDENVGKPSTLSKGIIGLIVVVIVLLAAGVYEYNTSKSPIARNEQVAGQETFSTPTPSQASSTTKTTAYKDGTYNAQGQYISPGGEEHIDVSLTLKNGNISDVTVTPQAFRPTSQEYQGIFAANYKPLVLGKNIDDVKLDEVSGSSLTPQGFNDAIAKIKQQAKS